jgi:hypothetical protein
VRLCENCYAAMLKKQPEKKVQRTLPLNAEREWQFTKMAPPYASRHPIPAGVVLVPGELAPFDQLVSDA